MERQRHRLQGSTTNVNHRLESLPGHYIMISWYGVEVQQPAGAGAAAGGRSGQLAPGGGVAVGAIMLCEPLLTS